MTERDCDRCGEEDGTIELGDALVYCQGCFDQASDEAEREYFGQRGEGE